MVKKSTRRISLNYGSQRNWAPQTRAVVESNMELWERTRKDESLGGGAGESSETLRKKRGWRHKS